jgi:hypothetical protein
MDARRFAAIAIAVLALSACGGTSDSSAAAHRAVAYMKALVAGDAATACPMLTAKAKQTIFGAGADCRQGMRALHAQLSTEQAARILSALKHAKGEATGTDATVSLTLDDGSTETLILKKIGDVWYVDGSS